MEYRIYYSFSGYGNTRIEADNKDHARELFDNGEYENNNEETENYEISDVEGPEELAEERRRQESHGIINNESMSRDEQIYCRCGNPVEEKGETCDQCWADKQAVTTNT